MDLSDLFVRIKLLVVIKVYFVLHWMAKAFAGVC